jgi:predicted AAA+ superfamily ATPase
VGGIERYVTLDDAAALSAASRDPDQFLAGLGPSVAIDEIQRVPELARALKRQIDLDRKPGRFLLTGSAAVMVLPDLARELVGRVQLQTLWPFTQGELEHRRDAFISSIFRELPERFDDDACNYAEMAQRIFKGAFPSTLELTSAEQRTAYFNSYLGTLLQRDVRDISQVRDLADFPRLLRLLAQRCGRLVNFSDLARILAMPQTTLKRYYAILQAMFLLSEVPPWFTNAEKQFAKAGKLLLSDTGLACAIQGIDGAAMQSDPEAGAFLLENFVGMELAKQLALDMPAARLLHFRLHAGAEVDWVIEDAAGRVIGLEVKASSAVRDEDFAGLRVLKDIAKQRFAGGVVLYCGGRSYRAGEGLCATPITALWRWNAAPVPLQM